VVDGGEEDEWVHDDFNLVGELGEEGREGGREGGEERKWVR
jgi:hypothetical protein